MTGRIDKFKNAYVNIGHGLLGEVYGYLCGEYIA